MSFNNANFILRDETRGIFQNRVWDYDTADTQADMNTANYFLAANATYNRGVKLGDTIEATVWTTSVPTAPNTGAIAAKVLFYVQGITISNGVTTAIDVADGDARTATDSD